MRRSADGLGGLGNSVSAAMREICDRATLGVYFLAALCLYCKVPSAVEAVDSPAMVGDDLSLPLGLGAARTGRWDTGPVLGEDSLSGGLSVSTCRT